MLKTFEVVPSSLGSGTPPPSQQQQPTLAAAANAHLRKRIINRYVRKEIYYINSLLLLVRSNRVVFFVVQKQFMYRILPLWRSKHAAAGPHGGRALLTTNPHDQTKSTNLELRFTVTETPKKGSQSIYSTDLYRGVIIPIFGNLSICRILSHRMYLLSSSRKSTPPQNRQLIVHYY